MTLRKAIAHSGIDHLDAELLLAHVLKKDRVWLLAHVEEGLAKSTERAFTALAARRKAHEPVAYITGEKEFYGRNFFVDQRVLIPRSSTEVLIDDMKKVVKLFSGAESNFQYVHTLKVPTVTVADSEIVILTYLKPQFSILPTGTFGHSPFSIIDIGAGSGCIGITLALDFPDAEVICTDTSEGALKVARENAKRHSVADRVKCTKTNLLSGVMPSSPAHAGHTEAPFLVVSNPPYIPSGTPLPEDVLDYEPREALFGGIDGMEALRPLLKQCQEHLQCIGCVLECRAEQAQALSRMMR